MLFFMGKICPPLFVKLPVTDFLYGLKLRSLSDVDYFVTMNCCLCMFFFFSLPLMCCSWFKERQVTFFVIVSSNRW